MPLRDDLLNPIPGDNPSGANLRYDPVYDKIKDARRVEDDAPQGDWQRERKVADYKLVIKLAGETLATRTKDLQLGAWLTEAMLRQEGFSGLRQGLDLLRGLIENFWDTLYPESEDGELELRAAPVEWVGTTLDRPLREAPITRSGLSFFKYKESRTVGSEAEASESDQRAQARAAAIADGKISVEDFDKDAAATPTAQYEAWVAALDGSQESLEALNLLCEQKFGNYAPGFSPVRAALEEVRHTVNSILQKRPDRKGAEPEPEPEPEAAVEEYAAAEDASGTAAAAPARKRVVAGLEPQDADDATARLAAVARFLRQQDPYSPAPYLLLRGYRWGELRGYGETPDPTLLLPPSSETRQNIRRLGLEANWVELLEAGETAMAQPCGRAWLDLQRYVVKAATDYGYPAIAAAIRSELRALLRDLPLLPTWTLMDDIPTANAETQAWLKELVEPVVEATAAVEDDFAASRMDETSVEAAAPGEPAPPDTYTLALEAARGGRAADAIQMLADEIPRQQSGRGRFQRKLQLAQICMMTGHEALARPILEDLALAIEGHKLEDWEAPDVVAHPLALLYRCLSRLDGDAATKQKLYARISRLDPVQALECEK
jgi:type VI secretion system protein ImpA